MTPRESPAAGARPVEARLALAADAAGLGAWELDLGTRALAASNRCKANHGLPDSAEISLDRDVVGTIDGPAQAPFVEAFERAIREGGVFEAEVPNTWPDGSSHWLLIRGCVVDGARMLGVTMDVTDRKRAEEALRAADRRKDDFLAVLGHELRNPLAAIIAAATFLEKTGLADPKLVRARETIVRQANQITRIVDDLMDIGRINAGKLELDRTAVHLKTVIAQAIEACGPNVTRRRHHLDVTLPDEDALIHADETRVVQAVCNLLNNAAKYMDDGGRIDLSASIDDGTAVIRVRDQGVGIDPDMLDVIFQRFVQVGSSRYATEGGLGLGLSLVKAIVELHGGRIEARSQGIGTGSEFIMRLPAAVTV